MTNLRKLKWSINMILKTLKELFNDLVNYYVTPYPILLIIGAFHRLCHRLSLILVPRGKGRPPVSLEVTDLILEMKRDNPGWGALRISQELALLWIEVSDEAVRKILLDNGFVPPKTRFTPVTWEAFFENHKHIWQIDLTSVFDSFGRQIFIFAAIDFESRSITSINATLNPTKEWIIQQICNASIAGFDLPTALIADNDGYMANGLRKISRNYLALTFFERPITSHGKMAV